MAVNGKRQPARNRRPFHEIRREWRDGDRIELTLDRTLRLEAVDEKHPDLLAVMQGPLALFAVGDRFLPFTRKDLMSAPPDRARNERVASRHGGRHADRSSRIYAIGGETTRRLSARVRAEPHQNAM